MKKFFKVFMVILCLCPMFLVAACKSPDNFLIDANPSDGELGSVQGVINEERPEGTKITLVAKEKNADTNPFICWVKDSKTVVSTNKNLTLTYGKNTSGYYTAVYSEDNHLKMNYTALTGVTFTTDEYTSATFEILSASITGGSNEYTSFYSGTAAVNSPLKTDNTSVLYFGKAGISNEFKFNVKVKMAGGQGTITDYEFQITTLLNRNLFDDDGKCVIVQSVKDLNTDVSLIFEKLNTSMFTNI